MKLFIFDTVKSACYNFFIEFLWEMEEEYAEILGNNIVCHSIPIRPGRNLAVICEAAAANHRQKKMGYNAAKELYRRVENNLRNGNSTEI